MCYRGERRRKLGTLARHSGKALDVEAASTSDGAISSSQLLGGDNQKWTFERL